MRRNIALALALVLGNWVSQSLAGGIVLQGARVVYDARKKGAALPVANRSGGLPYLLQSWIDNTQRTARGPFVITPPLFRLDAGNNSSSRIVKSSENIADDKGSSFFINVHAIPTKSQTTDVNNSMLALVFKTRVRLFYHPTNLVDKPHDTYKSLGYKYSNNELGIYNPPAYHVVSTDLTLGKTDLASRIDCIALGEHERLAVPAAAGKTMRWVAINEYGGTTKTGTQTLQ